MGLGLSSRTVVARTGGISGGYRYRTGEFGHGGGPTTEHGLRPRPQLHAGNFDHTSRDVPFQRSLFDARHTPVRRLRSASQGDGIDCWVISRAATYFDGPGRHGRSTAESSTYVAALGEPVFTDGASVGVEGFITYRLNLSASAGYSNGKSALRRDARNFDTYTGDVRLRYAWTRGLGVFAEYLYYFYDFRRSPQIAPGFPRMLERNGVRVGLVLWVPALGR